MFFFFSLLDVCLGQQGDLGKHLTLYLVFEHCKQDLATYISKAPAGGLSEHKIWVISYIPLAIYS